MERSSASELGEEFSARRQRSGSMPVSSHLHAIWAAARSGSEAYLSGALNLLPSPSGMVFWGSPLIRRLSGTLPFADQVLMLEAIARHEGRGIRVPQSGWLHHRTEFHTEHDPGLGTIRNTIRRTHRWQRVLRNDDDSDFAREDRVHIALFSAHPDDVRLYGKPMARNAQIWSSRFDAVLHGPASERAEIAGAIGQMKEGGSFGYRLFYPPMQVGEDCVFWHRPLVAFQDAHAQAAQFVECGVDGYLATAGAGERVELWPRLENGRSKGARNSLLHPPTKFAGATSAPRSEAVR